MRVKKIVLLSVALLLAFECLSAEIAITTTRVALKPGEKQTIKVTCKNGDKAEFNGSLEVKVFYDIAESSPIASKAVKLTPGEKKEFIFEWTPKVEHWGCTAVAELSEKEVLRKSASYVHNISANFLFLDGHAEGLPYSSILAPPAWDIYNQPIFPW